MNTINIANRPPDDPDVDSLTDWLTSPERIERELQSWAQVAKEMGVDQGDTSGAQARAKQLAGRKSAPLPDDETNEEEPQE